MYCSELSVNVFFCLRLFFTALFTCFFYSLDIERKARAADQ